MNRIELYKDFENLIADIFKHYNFNVENRNSHDYISSSKDGFLPDFIVSSSANIRAAVEVKIYLSRNVPYSTLMDAAIKLDWYISQNNIYKYILVVGNRVPSEQKKSLRDMFPNLIIYDIDVLWFLVSSNVDLVRDFESIVRNTTIFSDAINPRYESVDIENDISSSGASPNRSAYISSDQNKGMKICSNLKSIKKGKKEYRAYEKAVFNALKYIFESDLTSWEEQKSSDSDLSFYDIIARVSSDHDFWKVISRDFNSRYIIFECKNYDKQIRQGQIYTTEKYLYRAALRATAIIVSPEGAGDSALAAARGALREHGKLIMCLKTQDICEMLELRDSADDHNAILVRYLDNMLISLER